MEKNFMLQGATRLNKSEMKKITGGTRANACSGQSHNSCGGSCEDDHGNSGKCVWVKVWDSCACATGSTEEEEVELPY